MTSPGSLTPSTQPIDRGERLTALDGLRCLAVLLVLIHHFVQLPLPKIPGAWQGYLSVLLGLSYTGVDLFFVLSGFLIGGILLDHADAKNLFSVFYLRRTLRIVPLYYAFLAVGWGLMQADLGVGRSIYPLGSYFSFLCNFWMASEQGWDPSYFAVAWSLAIEEQFYLLFPLLVRFTSRRVLTWVVIASLGAAPLLRYLLLTAWPEAPLGSHLLMPMRMDSLGTGVLIALAVRNPGVRSWLAARPRLPLYVLLSTLPILAYLTASRSPIGGLAIATLGYSTLNLLYGCAVLIAVLGKPAPVHGLLTQAPLVYLGRVSYFVYLFHGIVGSLVFGLFTGTYSLALANWQDFWLMLASVALVLVFAGASWRWLEGPLVSYGRKHEYRPRNRSGARPAPSPVAAASSL